MFSISKTLNNNNNNNNNLGYYVKTKIRRHKEILPAWEHFWMQAALVSKLFSLPPLPL